MKAENKGLLPTITILLATQGNEDSLQEIVKHYERYIIRLCQKDVIDEVGNKYQIVDEEMKQQLEAKLILATMNFKIQ